jgi:hypothetical protein
MRCLSAIASLLLVLAPATAADTDQEKLLAQFSQSEFVMKAKLTGVQAGPVQPSIPPVHHFTVQLADPEMLRGTKPETLQFRYQFRGENPPAMPKDAVVLVGGKTAEKLQVLTIIIPSDDKMLTAVKRALSVPAGWKIVGENVKSPWADLGDKPWHKSFADVRVKCAQSGRPMLLVGDAVSFTVEQVKPAMEVKFKNTYGDGQFKLTVTNKSDKPVQVPALLTDGKDILWDECVVVLSKDAVVTMPRAGKATTAKSVELKPGESVSGVIDVLPLSGIEWPKGGQRVYMQFCLGEKVQENFFYYHSGHHDALREAAIKKLKGS